MSHGSLDQLLTDIRACRRCIDAPRGQPLPHEPRPVLRMRATARLAIFSQAPGVRVHASGLPFTDPSGDRLRGWMGLDKAAFYDERRVAIVPMGFCFPGHDAKGGDLPPRRECAAQWRGRVMAHLGQLELALLIGQYALRWHLGDDGRGPLTDTVAGWRQLLERPSRPRLLPLPHPSWRNNGWLRANPWFEDEVVPELQQRVRSILGD